MTSNSARPFRKGATTVLIVSAMAWMATASPAQRATRAAMPRPSVSHGSARPRPAPRPTPRPVTRPSPGPAFPSQPSRPGTLPTQPSGPTIQPMPQPGRPGVRPTPLPERPNRPGRPSVLPVVPIVPQGQIDALREARREQIPGRTPPQNVEQLQQELKRRLAEVPPDQRRAYVESLFEGKNLTDAQKQWLKAGLGDVWDKLPPEKQEQIRRKLIEYIKDNPGAWPPPPGYVYPRPPYGFYPIPWYGHHYYYYDGIYLSDSPTQEGYEVVYPPIGMCVDQLPSGAQQVQVNGLIYFEANGVYYQHVFDGARTCYRVVEPPRAVR